MEEANTNKNSISSRATSNISMNEMESTAELYTETFRESTGLMEVEEEELFKSEFTKLESGRKKANFEIDPNDDGIEQLFKAYRSDDDDDNESKDDEEANKGVCYEIAENPELVCKKGVCRPTPRVKEAVSETGRDYLVRKKICHRPENYRLTCMNRPPDKKRKFGTDCDGIDSSKCQTLIETTIFKSTDDRTLTGADEEGLDDDSIPVAAVCECCHCAICRCKPKYVKRLIDSGMDVKKFGLLGQTKDKLRMVYSWDTIRVPEDWDFARQQESIRRAEMEELIAQAERLEREQIEILAATGAEEEEKEYGEDDLSETIEERRLRMMEDEWAKYKAIEWGALRQEYTKVETPIDRKTLATYSNTSWTSQPPPQLLLGTISKKKKKTTFTTTAPYLGLDEESAKEEKMSDSSSRMESEDISSVEIELRPSFHEGHLPKEKPKKKSKREVMDENLLPLGLKREAHILKRSQQSQTKALKDKTKKIVSHKLLSADASARLAALQKLDAGLLMTQSCPCLPGFCTCEGRAHWTFRQSEVELKWKEKDVGLTDSSQLREAGIYVWKDYECPCPHLSEDINVSPESSGEFMVARSPTKKKVEEGYVCTCTKRYEQTVLIVKPDAMIFEDVIRRAILYVGGLQIVNERKIRLSPEQVSEIYEDKCYGNQSYPLLVLKMSRRPILVLCIAGLRCMDVVKSMIGEDKLIPESWFLPESIKHRIVPSGDLLDTVQVSEDAEQFAMECRYFFPQTLIEPIPTIRSRVNDFCKTYLDPTLSKGLAIVAKTKPLDPIIFLAEWLLTHNPYQPWYKPTQINLVSI